MKLLKVLFIQTIFVLVSVISLSALNTDSITGEEVLTKVDAHRNFSDSGFAFDFILTDMGNDEENQSTMRVFVRDPQKVLAKYIKPESKKGEFVLMDKNNFWYFDTGMYAPIRISPRQMLTGQASSGDITRIIYSKLYNVESMETEDDSYVLKLSAISGAGATYDNITLYVNKSNYRPEIANCYANTGVLLKTINYMDFKTINEKVLLTGFEIINEMTQETNMVELSNFKLEELPASYYNKDYMRFLEP